LVVTDDPFDLVLSRLERVRLKGRQAEALCPAHKDHKRSFSVSGVSRIGKVLLDCKAGCAYDDVLKALGLTRIDLWPPSEDRDNGTVKDEEAWQRAEKERPLVKHFVGQFMRTEIQAGRNTYKASYELHNQIGAGFLQRDEVYQDLEDAGMEAMVRAVLFWKPWRGTLAQYAAPIVGRRLVEWIVDEELPESKTGGIRVRQEGQKKPGWVEDQIGDEVAERLDSEAEGISDRSPILLTLSGDSGEEEASRDSGAAGHTRGGKGSSSSQSSSSSKPRGRGRPQTSPALEGAGLLRELAESPELSAKADELKRLAALIEVSEHSGQRIAGLRMIIAAARAELKQTNDPEKQKELRAAIRNGYRNIERLENL
jgi:hypothetical protein